MPVLVPPALASNVVETWADEGARWLARLPALVADVARDWQLTLGAPYLLSFHWVAPATRADGSPAVLKLGVPAGHLAHEAQALRAYGGHGAVRLLADDLDRGALLLERAEPGGPAAALVPRDDEAATAALIGVGRRLHRAVPDGCTLPDLRKESESFRAHLRRFPGDDPLPRHLVEHAGQLFDELCASAPEHLLLHGDLHHDNVLRAGREPWLAIDPHGVVGDPGYDCGAMLYNPQPWRREEDLLALVPTRIEQLADGFAIPVDRVVAWGFVMGVLSEVWTAQGSGTPGSRALDVATMLYPRLS
ncbi:MAG TPA: aminoglycoside phosphotransferase family protein [Micromonosporaceae bacterium]|nr:aminoglycoside phosphotransferase family protein [Micromonosporaceae bacterium]